MPNRILRDSIRTSHSLSLLSAEEERHFYRLLVLADDYGRFDARPEVIKGFCYPLLNGSVSTREVDAWTRRLASNEVDILGLYEVGGLTLAYFRHWGQYQRTRALESRYPPPPDEGNHTKNKQSQKSVRDNICQHLPTDVAVTEDEVENEVGVGDETGSISAADKSARFLPDLLTPLSELQGFKNRDYANAVRVITQQCTEAGIEPLDAVANFAEFYKLNRTKYGWTDPVAALRRNLGRTLADMLKQGDRAGPAAKAKAGPWTSKYEKDIYRAQFRQEHGRQPSDTELVEYYQANKGPD